MGWIQLQAADGHHFHAYLQNPSTSPVGMVLVLQEIFGVNEHIESVCNQWAAQGWLAIAPALFDRVEGQQSLGYTAEDIGVGRSRKEQVGDDQALLDIEAVVAWGLKQKLKIAVMGFCWGGTLAWLASSKLAIDAAVIYYGTNVAGHLAQVPSIPLLMHFGETDTHIPMDDVRKISAACPHAQINLYPAGHGFNCDMRGSFHAPSAALASQRSEQFLLEKLAQLTQ
jgi:carboxymethylenebutenolidase